MLSHSPIRKKLLAGITILLVIVVTLSASGFQGVYAYRGLVKSLRARADELPLATTLLEQISDLRATAAAARAERWSADLPGQPIGIELIQARFKTQFETAENTLQEYRAQLVADESDDRIGDIREEENVARQIRLSLDRVRSLGSAAEWGIDDPKHEAIESELAQLQSLSAELPSHLHRRLGVLAGEVRTQYRSLIGLLSVTSLSAAALLGVLIRFFYRWVFRPLDVLVKGSRRVAAGEFSYRIELSSRDEMAELACAMNDMTARFRAIRDDLDRQVQVRTRQVVRSEQLASVGFLAAGVAHEINNPLASIAMCAESLESRLAELCRSYSPCADRASRIETALLQGEDGTRSLPAAFDDQLPVIEHYLRMIQSEAFRCKEITEKLLDFSRIGEVKRQHADLGELIAGVIDMVRHLGKYQDRRIVFAPGSDMADGPAAQETASGKSTRLNVDPIIAEVNAQEMKQVVLNLITNALDSLDPGGTLEIQLGQSGDKAEILFSDDGCGMTEEVLAHLFEPFFTRKRSGQGTGLGLSIVYRIVTDHGGQIDAESDGPGRGSRFRIALPLAQPTKERRNRYQAA